ncbi:MAG TPA: hypothetical protein VH280_24270 [Verrucomicrobiae bacterium]|jgi:hypothetical protein|nr:hypothetical protein [Verrucomicrobiae bacterium]
MNTLESRKQSLMAESEVNRIELLKDWEALKADATRVRKHLFAAGSIASSAAVLATVAALIRRHHEQPTAPKPESHSKVPWVSAAMDGARVGASLFFKVRSFMRERR